MVLHPRFDEEEIQKEKGVILEELKMENDNPESVVHELFVSNFWKRHPLGRPIIGTKKTITAFEREAIVNYHRRFYAPANLTITAAGNLKHEQIVELAERHFGGLPQGGEIPKLTKPEAEAPLILKNRRSLEQVHLCIGAPCYEMTHPLRFACYTLNVILGGSMSSRLFQNVRERLGLAYSIFSELSQYQDSGCLAVYAGTSAETVGKLVACVMEEFRRLKEEPVAAEELRRAKEHMKGSMLLSLESTSSRMGNLARQWLSFGRFFTLDELAASIDAVTAEQVQAVAREFFVTEKIGVTMLGRLDSVSLGRENLIC
jgi:predicted Zn-dependent peptidase